MIKVKIILRWQGPKLFFVLPYPNLTQPDITSSIAFSKLVTFDFIPWKFEVSFFYKFNLFLMENFQCVVAKTGFLSSSTNWICKHQKLASLKKRLSGSTEFEFFCLKCKYSFVASTAINDCKALPHYFKSL